MKPAERPQFKAHLQVLCAGLDVPCTAEREQAYWIALQDMPLAVFIRTIEHILREEEWAKMPKPGQVWAASKRMRAEGPTKPHDDGWRGDNWDIAANKHLLGRIVHAIHDRKPVEGLARLLEAKRQWSADMRKYGTECPVDIQRQCWDQRMEEAEADIARQRAA